MQTAPAALIGLAALTGACAPMTREDAERACLRDAQLAQHPRGEVFAGVGMGGGGGVRPVYGGSITISTDYLGGRDPSKVYESCVYNRSGELPSRPFYDLPASRG